MNPLDIGRLLTDPEYTVRNLSETIVRVNPAYDLLAQLGLFREQGVPNLFVEFERKDFSVSILPTSVRGGPGSTSTSRKRQKFALGTSYIKFEDKLTGSDLQGLPAFGDPELYEQFEMKLLEKSSEAMLKFNQTHEWLRWGALNGDVYDADGQTKLFNVYEEFGEEQASFDYNFAESTKNVAMTQNNLIRRYMEKNLRGERMTAMLAICSPEFFEALTNHPYYYEFYIRQQGMPANPIIEDVSAGFRVGNVLYMEHNGCVNYVDPNTAEEFTSTFITSGEAIGLPLGTIDVFNTYFAPGTALYAVNQPGQPLYTSLKELDHSEGIEIRYETAPLHAVKHPRTVIRLYSSSDIVTP